MMNQKEIKLREGRNILFFGKFNIEFLINSEEPMIERINGPGI
jgi:hypothetical protein